MAEDSFLDLPHYEFEILSFPAKVNQSVVLAKLNEYGSIGFTVAHVFMTNSNSFVIRHFLMSRQIGINHTTVAGPLAAAKQPNLCRDEGCDHAGTDHVCLSALDAAERQLADTIRATASPQLTDELARKLSNTSDQYVWSDEFCLLAAMRGFDPQNPADRDWLATWFANAMMNGYDRGVNAEIKNVIAGQVGDPLKTVMDKCDEYDFKPRPPKIEEECMKPKAGTKPACKKPWNCYCKEKLGNDFGFLPADRCLLDDGQPAELK